MPKINWHALKLTEVFKELDATKQGLTAQEVRARLKKHGENVLPHDKRPSVFSIFARQLKSPLVYVLLAAALVTAFLREFVDTVVIMAAVVVNSAIGFWQELKADEAFLTLKAMVKHSATVLRDGSELRVDASQVIPGDIVVLQAGDRIPADGRLITVYGFETNEAALTGESLPVEKQLKVLPAPATLAERSNMVFQGTTVARGKALVVVTATGLDTAFGEIALLVREVEEPVTPLQQQLKRLAKWLGVAAFLITVSIFALGVFQGRSIVEMFLIGVAVAVAVIPEGLIISLTVILAIGMRKLAFAKAIVKRLIAAETLGSVSVICTDKTGTLTTGEMEVAEIWTAENLKGDGGYLETRSPSRRRPSLPPSIQKALEIAVVGNEAVISNPEARLKEWEIHGDPTPAALLRAGIHAGLDPRALARQYPETDEIPFDTEHKWAATLHKCKGDEHNILNVRGAPERLLQASKFYLKGERVLKISAAQKRAFNKKLEEMAQRGDRVVAVAYSELRSDGRTLKELKHDSNPPGDLVFVGFFGLKDPLRADTREVIERASAAGVRTVMITGDHAKTAVAIGMELGLVGNVPPLKIRGGRPAQAGAEGLRTAHNPPHPSLNLREGDNSLVLTGEELDKMEDEEFAKRIQEVRIFARVLPKHKVRIVDAYHARGETVAMTGDGVNDAPALKAADIGVAVGSGTDVAREAADVVLTDNNLATIVRAVEGGRNIYANVKKVVAYLLSDSWAEIIMVVGSLVMGLPLPVLAAQILWVNLIEDSLPNMALAFDAGDSMVMHEKPRKRNAAILDLELKIIIFGVGIITALMLFGLYLFLLDKTDDLEYIRTMVFVGLAITSLFFIYPIRSFDRFIWQINPFNNRLLIVATMVGFVMLIGAVYAPPLQTLLRTVPLSARDWVPLLGLGLITIALIEVVKGIFIVRRHKTKDHK